MSATIADTMSVLTCVELRRSRDVAVRSLASVARDLIYNAAGGPAQRTVAPGPKERAAYLEAAVVVARALRKSVPATLRSDIALAIEGIEAEAAS